MTTFSPTPPDVATSSVKSETEPMPTETPTVVDFESAAVTREQFIDRLPQRWGLIASVVGGSIALATAATVVVSLIARRRVAPVKVYGFRPIRRVGLRHLETPRGGGAWLGYIYRTPDLRVRVPIRK
jgi:hypothetical protein